MSSPFDKRAIERIRDDVAFLPYIASAPFEVHLKPHAADGTLYDRLVVMSGTPGSGKTTMAQLFRLRTLRTLQQMAERSNEMAELQQALAACKAYKGELPRVAGCRLSMEEKYRDCWELGYDEALRQKILRTLVNARAMLGWLQGFRDAGLDLSQVRIISRSDAGSSAEFVGLQSTETAYERAKAVERAAYGVCAALVPPAEDALPEALRTPYDALDVLERFVVTLDGRETELVPLIILDDVFWLHESQQRYLIRWLAGREISIARWILTRFDSFGPRHILNNESIVQALAYSSEPGVQQSRDIVEIRLQGERSKSRGDFRKVARQISTRYLQQISIMKEHAATDLELLLDDRLVVATKEQLRLGKAILDRAKTQAALPDLWIKDIQRQVGEYLSDHDLRGDEGALVGDAMTAILLARQARRTPQTSIFDSSEAPEDLELIEERLVRPSTSIEHGARIHLWHEAKVPYLFGYESLADLANENTERFVDFAGQLVRLLQTRVIRARKPRLTAQQQFDTLQEHARQMVSSWNFPESSAVKRIALGMAAACVAKSREPNASLGGGASAFGIPRDEFLSITDEHRDLARALQFGVAYNVFNLVPNQRAKNRDWFLIELCGPVLLANGLTLQRGGFLERRVSHLEEFRMGRDAEVAP